MNKVKFINLKKVIITVVLTFYNLFLFSQTVEIPVVEYVTVNQISKKPIIKWSVNNETSLSGYFVKRYIYSCPNYNQNWHTIATIHSPNQLIFEDNTTTCEAKPNERSEKYFVRAFKIVGNDTILSDISEYHRTIFLETEYNYCEKANHLVWNKYIGWGNNIIGYEVYYENSANNFIKIGTNTFSDTTFIHENVNDNETYKYFVKAIKNDGVSSNSNISEVYTKTINFPQFLKPDSIISDNTINLYFSIDKNSDTKRYILYKSNSVNGTFDSIMGFVQNNNTNINFSDINNNKLNYYYVSAIDYCNGEIFKSEIVNNIFLEAKKKNDLEKITELKWNSNVNEEYKIFRCNKPQNTFYEINTTFNLNYNDDINEVFANQFSENENNGEFCYRVVSEENNVLNKSNIACVKYNETVFVANAFNPKSNILENRTFKPKIAFVKDYELIVYGNFGDIIFQTTNPNIGWDGNLPNGKLAKRAAYLYYISYTNSFGKRVTKKNFVSLVY